MKKGKTKKPKEPQKEKQLDLGIKEPFRNRFFKYRGKTDRFVRTMEVRKYLKDPLTWLVIVFGLILIGTQGYLIYINLDTLPSVIPVLKYQINNISRLEDSLYIIIFPIISLVILISTIGMTAKFYSRERILSQILLSTAFLSILSETVILVDIINKF